MAKMKLTLPLLLAPLAMLYGGDLSIAQSVPSRQLLQDSSFEACPAGAMASTGAQAGWEIQRTGRPAIQDRLVVACVENEAKAKSGKQCLSLSIPKDTVGFEFVTVGQRVQLAAGKEYEASLWVRWPAGPDAAPPKANSVSGHPSAIVSFWARHRDNHGAFAGRDEWLFDNRWHQLTFRFYATDPEQRTFIYVSLLPNQKPTDTTILVDGFELVELAAQPELETRTGSITLDPDFAKQSAETISPPWYFANMGGHGISGQVLKQEGSHFVRLAMGQATSNFESAQLWQHVSLRKGVPYTVSCRIRWDNFAANAAAPIVNYGIYHEETRTWYGPVDQVLEKTGEWRTYRFTHIPPCAGTWKLYVQLNGWGNFGHPVTISLRDFLCQHGPRSGWRQAGGLLTQPWPRTSNVGH